MAQLRPGDLKASLARGLAPVYLVAGEEPLLLEEALDAIRAAARATGCEEREVLHADGSFDWGRLAGSGASLSLFSRRRLLELRLPGSKPGVEGGKALAQWCAAPPHDVVLVVAAGRLDSRARNSAWVKALARAGHFLYAWPVDGSDLPRWISARAAAAGLRLDRDAAALLAARSEGNLLAAAQEVDKLVLQNGAGSADVELVQRSVADNARFGVFDLSQAVLEGRGRRAVRVLDALRQEGTEPPVVLWGLARELRAAARLAAGEAGAAGPGPPRRNQALSRAAGRAPVGRWRDLLRAAARVDRVLKGAEPGSPWDELVNLALEIAAAAGAAAAPRPGVPPAP